jgi:arylsulfatase A-like enzyme
MRALSVALVTVVASLCPIFCTAAEKPNFVFFLVDDLGYMDIGANNPNTFYETPHIDSIANSGMRFTNGYAANPVCSPTRYSIMTGKYPSRVCATDYFCGKREGRFRPAPLNDRMPLAEVTLAEALREAGYRTAFLGKWHLGPTEDCWPKSQGFDINVGGHHSGSPRSFFSPYHNPKLADGPKGEHLPERLADEATNIIEQFKDRPFLIYLSFYSVHKPLQAPHELIEKYRKKADKLRKQPEFALEEQVWQTETPRKVRTVQNHAKYAAMVESVDTAIGRVLDKLANLGLDENTVIVFMSDNGGLSTVEDSPTSNLPLRGGKGWLYEGGIREPFLIKWPGVTPGGKTCDQPVISTDFYPTILEIAGVPARPKQHLDGVSLAPLLKGEKSLGRDAIFWHYPHYSNPGGFPGAAIRVDNYKLIERFEDGRVHLYDLKNDIGERNDLSEKMPEKVDQMSKRLHTWYREVDAKLLEQKPGGPMPWRPEDYPRSN